MRANKAIPKRSALCEIWTRSLEPTIRALSTRFYCTEALYLGFLSSHRGPSHLVSFFSLNLFCLPGGLQKPQRNRNHLFKFSVFLFSGDFFHKSVNLTSMVAVASICLSERLTPFGNRNAAVFGWYAKLLTRSLSPLISWDSVKAPIM